MFIYKTKVINKLKNKKKIVKKKKLKLFILYLKKNSLICIDFFLKKILLNME